MRKLLTALLVLTSIGVFTATVLHANDINVTIDDVTVEFDGQGPVIVDGHTLVPVRGVFTALGFGVGWDAATQTVTLSSEEYSVTIAIGSDTFTTNGVSRTLYVPAQIIGGSTMLPIRAVVESVGHYVDWDGAASTVIIATQPIVPDLRTAIIGRWQTPDGIDGIVFSEGTLGDFGDAFRHIDDNILYHLTDADGRAINDLFSYTADSDWRVGDVFGWFLEGNVMTMYNYEGVYNIEFRDGGAIMMLSWFDGWEREFVRMGGPVAPSPVGIWGEAISDTFNFPQFELTEDGRITMPNSYRSTSIFGSGEWGQLWRMIDGRLVEIIPNEGIFEVSFRDGGNTMVLFGNLEFRRID